MAATLATQEKTSGVGAERVEAGSINIPSGTYPDPAPAGTNPDEVADQTTDALNQGLAKKDARAVADLFLENSYWRDHLASSWDLRTLKGKKNIEGFLQGKVSLVQLKVDRSSDHRKPKFGPLDLVGDPQGVTYFVTFTSEVGSGRGIVRVASEGGKSKIFTLFLTLEELQEHTEPLGENRARGVEHGGQTDRRNWLARRQDEQDFKDTEPTVLIVGSGQAGLTSSARLKMLGVNALVIDQNDRVGDNWRKRYEQLVLHDPIWYDHMPYVSFPKSWPVFTPKDKLAEFFEAYVKILELNVWTKTTLVSSSWDDKSAKWTVELERTKADGSKEKRTVHPRHIIQATGHSGKKNFPTMNGMDSFKGDVLCHSSEFPGAKKDSKGKKAIVVGACNSGHDICQDFYEKGYDITMVQRSATTIVSSESITEIGLKGLYSEDAPPTEDADVWLWGMPSEILKTQQARVADLQRENDATLINGLAKVGFKMDKGPGGGGLFIKYFQRGGGYYIEVGASQLIIDGKIKIKQGQEITEVLPHGLRFADGSELEADEIVFATGYQNMRTQARAMFGDELGDRVKDVWGFDEEGEFRAMYRRSGHPGFWFFGGNLAICRYFSRILALQIKAVEAGLSPRDGNVKQ